MSPETEFADQLQRALEHLPAHDVESYLKTGQRARRRRGAMVGVLTACAVTVAAVGATAILGPDPEPTSVAGQPSQGPSAAPTPPDPATRAAAFPDPDYVAPQPNNPVEAVDGLKGVDHFTTETIPEWAQEYGNHGPVSIAPDGRLWVAPDAHIRRTVIDPLAPGDADAGEQISASYAVEADFDMSDRDKRSPDEFSSGVVWVLVFAYASDASDGGAAGEMDDPGRWTNDFELWVDNVTSQWQDRPSFAERLVHFTNDDNLTLTPGQGVTIVRQQPAQLPGGEEQVGSSAAEVRWAGKTWFVEAHRQRSGDIWFDVYEPAVSARDLPGFIQWLQDRS